MSITRNVTRLRPEPPPVVRDVLRWLGWAGLVLAIYTVLLLVFGKNPLDAYVSILTNTLGSTYGLSEVVVKMIPLVILALAVAVPARIGLINVGGEGQLFVGGLAAAWVGLTFGSLVPWLVIPLMVVAGFAGGGLWAALAGVLRAKGWLNEVFSTLLMNYVAILLVQFLVFGPWRDPGSGNYPQSRELAQQVWLPTFFDTRVHLGLLLAVLGLFVFWLVMSRTRWGLEMRAIGGNPEAARRGGISVGWYIVIVLAVGGGLAGVAGMSQVAGLDHRLSPSISPGYGYIGFLISWLAGHQAGPILAFSFLLAVLAAGGDILQITQGLPYAAVNILSALILLMVLAGRARRLTT